MANPMVLVDEWTTLMIVILAVQTGVALLAGKKDRRDEEGSINA